MGVARVAGYPDYSAGGTSGVIPEVWSGRLADKLYDATILNQITNNNWEGEIKDSGDKVYIRTIPTGTVNNYVK